MDTAADPDNTTPKSLPLRRYKLTLAYDGSGFHGWQKQIRPVGSVDDGAAVSSEDGLGVEHLRTVAGVVEAALRRVLRQPITLVGASRTDAGVHAFGQVAHFDAATPVPIQRMAKAINGGLPEDVEVRGVEVVDASFDAITDAVTKRYRYRLFNTHRRPLALRHVVWHCWTELDVAKMADAAGRVVGTHDFAGFAAADHGRATTVRTVHRCVVTREDPEVHIVIEGGGFLYNMVRIVAGTLVEVGRGRFEPAVVDRVLEAADRRLAGPTLPASGLCLEWIRYPGDSGAS